MENKIANINTTKGLLEEHNLLAKKSLGQNFIVDSNIINNIMKKAQLSKDSAVIEIGPGLGSLTEEMLERAKEVISIEIDQNMVEILNKVFKDKENFTLINEDILDFDLVTLVNKLKSKYSEVVIVANLPYYITSDILLRLFKLENKVNKIIVMVQKEYVERLSSSKNTKDYRSLTVIANTFYKTKKLLKISRHVFYPKPRVDSSVIMLSKKDREIKNINKYVDFIEKCFIQKRKTIYNNLKNNFKQEDIEVILNKSNIEKSMRPAQLDVEEFIRMYEVYYEEKIVCES